LEGVHTLIDLMIDIETTGVHADKHAIIPLACIPFDLDKREKGESFCECLQIPSDREWMESTRDWWEKTNAYRLEEILSNGRPHLQVLLEFDEYVRSFGKNVRFWSHHSIDWEMVEHYFRSYDIVSPFTYRSFVEMDSYLLALEPDNIGKYKPVININDQHDALFDCDHQINWLFNTLDKGSVNEST
jgi:DNA polymerase III epsilon subunit-like protein